MFNQQRIHVSILLVLAILLMPLTTILSAKEDSEYNTIVGQIYLDTLRFFHKPTALVLDDLTVVYQQKCRRQISVARLKPLLYAPGTKEATKIAGESICSEQGCDKTRLTPKQRQQYTELISGIQCPA